MQFSMVIIRHGKIPLIGSYCELRYVTCSGGYPSLRHLGALQTIVQEPAVHRYFHGLAICGMCRFSRVYGPGMKEG